MTGKIAVTRAEIEKDIINAMKQPQHMSEVSYRKWTVPLVILACLLVVVELVYPIFIVWLLLGLLIGLPVIGMVARLRLRRRIKRVSLEDYELRQETVKSVAEESYVGQGAQMAQRKSRQPHLVF